MEHGWNRIDRRAFVLGSAALVASAGVAIVAEASATRPGLVLCDRALLSRLTLAERTAPLVAFDGDLTSAWLEHLQPLWAKGPATVTGIATPAGLHCLEELARGERHRIVERTELPGGGAIRFRIAPVGARVPA